MKTVQSEKLIIETDIMTSQHFGSKSFPFRLTQKQKEQKWARVDMNKKRFLRISTFFFLDISHRHYRFGLKGGFCWIVSRLFSL